MEQVGRQDSPDPSCFPPPEKKIKKEKKEWVRGPGPSEVVGLPSPSPEPRRTGEQGWERDRESYTTVFVFTPVFLFWVQEVTAAKGASGTG